jgi:hypothetical protein
MVDNINLYMYVYVYCMTLHELIEEEKRFAPQATPSHFLMCATGATNCIHC